MTKQSYRRTPHDGSVVDCHLVDGVLERKHTWSRFCQFHHCRKGRKTIRFLKEVLDTSLHRALDEWLSKFSDVANHRHISLGPYYLFRFQLFPVANRL